ncbi:MAG: Maf family protein [Tepidisphaeraceae bacterium]|jgi:septum formation protein
MTMPPSNGSQRPPGDVGGARSLPPPGRLILASASPRRQQLLREWGFDFTVQPANLDEESASTGNLLPSELAVRLALAKAQKIAGDFPADIVLGADTVVAFGDKSMSKPLDADDARRMLALLAGTTHIVITGLAVVWKQQNVERVRHVMSAVHMRPLTAAEIETYVAGGQWEGKAGAYGIQDDDPFVTNMAGSHSNIVGLPMETTSEMLAEVGIVPK